VEKLLPQNIEAEAAVLGSILIDPEAIMQVADYLKPDDFYRDAHRVIYQAALELYQDREPADLITLTDELGRRGKLDDVGGASYVTSLANQVPTSANVDYYGHIVERTAVLRRLIHAAGQIAAIAYDEPDAAIALDQAEKLIFNIGQRFTRSDFERVSDTLREYIDKLEQLQEHRGTVVGVPTGFSDLDKMTGGLQKSDLIILAARPAVGKTAMALSLAHNAALRHGQSVAVFSLEMSKEQLVARLLSMDAAIDQSRLRTGFLDDSEWERISISVGELSKADIYVDDTPGITLVEMRSKARRLMMDQGFSLLIVDYLQLMQGSGMGRGHENRVQEVSEISRGLKGLARELNVPVMALAQLSRAVESRTEKKPQLSDLRESGCLAGETLIYLPDEGVHRRIDELVGKSGFNVLALNTQTWKLERQPVSRAFATGRKPVFRLTTRLGRSLRATASHKFLTIAGWRRLDELAPGTRIALPRTLPGPETATMRDEELALLGHLIGDGCTLPKHAMQYTTKDLDLAEIVAALAVQVCGDAVRPRIEAQRTWYQVYLPSTAHLTHRVHGPIVQWLDELGVFGLRSYEKRVPERVFHQPAAQIAIFLRHLWATDGCIHLSHTTHYPGIYYASSSIELAKDVQLLLLRLGINATLATHPQNGKGRHQHHVVVSGKPDMERFLAVVGAVGSKKQQQRKAVQDYPSQHGVNTGKDVIPREAWNRLILPALRVRGMERGQLMAAIGYKATGALPNWQNLSRERALRFASAMQCEELLALAESDVYWDEILAVEPDGEAEVFDLTVDLHHNFTANGAIVHNSIEQDADIVMFIYREEVYNPDTERKNIADIIVAKHRNGPVGQVSLYFQASQTRYRDLDLQRTPDYTPDY
jgi:replicative DNA helicase